MQHGQIINPSQIQIKIGIEFFKPHRHTKPLPNVSTQFISITNRPKMQLPRSRSKRTSQWQPIFIDYSITPSFSNFALIIVHNTITRFLNLQKGKKVLLYCIFSFYFKRWMCVFNFCIWKFYIWKASEGCSIVVALIFDFGFGWVWVCWFVFLDLICYK